MLVGLGLWFLRREDLTRQSRLGLVFAGLAAAIGAVTLLEYGLGRDLGIDQLLFREAVLAEGGPFPGRPSPAAALNLLLVGLALLTLDAGPVLLSPLFAIPALLIALLSAVGYA